MYVKGRKGMIESRELEGIQKKRVRMHKGLVVKKNMGTWKEVSNLLISYSRGRMGLLKRLVKKAFMTFLCCCLHFHFLKGDRNNFTT